MAYNSKYTGAEVDALLDKVAENDVISIDSALSTTSENAVQNKAIAEEFKRVDALEEIHKTLDVTVENLVKKKVDAMDYAPHLSVGVADNLSGVDVIDSEFTSRQSGGGAILDGTARIEAIKGNSVVWNQIVNAALIGGLNYGNPQIETTDSGIIYTFTEEGNFAYGDGSRLTFGLGNNIVANHKYAVLIDVKTPSTGIQLFVGETVWDRLPVTPNTLSRIGRIQTITEVNNNYKTQGTIYPIASGASVVSGDVLEVYNPIVYDLTKMFGVGNEPTTVEEVNKRIPIEVNQMVYNEGQMINLNPSGIESYSADEEPIERFQDLSLIGTLFPDGMKSVGEFHDEIRYNKETQKWEKITRIGEVDLGSLNWSYASGVNYFYSAPSEDIGGGNTFKDTNKQTVLINSADFTGLHWTAFTNNYVSPRNNAISLYYTPDYDAVRANICCDDYTDVASFKEYLQGKKAYFVLNDPIVEEFEFDGNLDYQVWNGGTEKVVPYEDNPTTALKADIAYGFNAKGLITELRGRIEAMTAQMLQMQTSLTQMSVVNEE